MIKKGQKKANIKRAHVASNKETSPEQEGGPLSCSMWYGQEQSPKNEKTFRSGSRGVGGEKE